MKKFSIPLLFFVLNFFPFATFADPALILNTRNAANLPKNFRTASLLAENPKLNTTGLSQLKIAGSAQFSKLSLEKVIQKLRTKEIVVIDLRQESHGFLNGNAISWYSKGNAENRHRTSQEIEETQDKLLDDLDHLEFAKVTTVLSKTSNEEIDKKKITEFLVRRVATEEQIVNDYHLKYYRLYVTDHHRPKDLEVDRFIEIINAIPSNQYLYFHCLAGVGRTSVFMAMYDMMKNAKKVSFEDIIKRHAQLGGKDLSVIPSKNEYKYKMTIKRYEFLKAFYDYAHDNTDGFETSWTVWKNRNSLQTSSLNQDVYYI